jgi:hypothetical protein
LYRPVSADFGPECVAEVCGQLAGCVAKSFLRPLVEPLVRGSLQRRANLGAGLARLPSETDGSGKQFNFD